MRKLLVVIDMQKDFVTGVLGTKEAQKIVPNVVKKIKKYQGGFGEVWFTKDTHGPDYLNTQEGKLLPVKHCIKGESGWEIIPEIIEVANTEAWVFEKDKFASVSVCKGIFDEYKNKQSEVEVELIGVCTDICVVSNALLLKAMLPEMRITVNASCCAGVTPEKHLAALETMRSCQINVVNMEE